MGGGIIREIDSSTPYRYLGVEQVFRAQKVRKKAADTFF